MKKSDAIHPRSKRSVLVAMALVALGQTAWAQTLDQSMMAPSDAALLADYEAYDSRCRGNSGDDPETWVACGARDYIGYLLNGSGYCFGQTGQPDFEWAWHICNAKSNRLEKP
jgi:hypothetical protein